MCKIYLFGDSVMKGVTFSEAGNSFSIHKRRLDVGADTEIENRSVFGATANKVWAEMNRRLPENAEGDIVVLSFGGNDSDHDWAEVSAKPGEDHGPKTPVGEFEKLLAMCIDLAKTRGAKVLVSNLVPIDAHKYMDRISRGLSRENILCWLGSENMLYRWHEYYDCVVRSVAARLGVPVVDLRTPFLLSHEFNDLLSADGIHPTEKGHCLIDRTLSESLGA